MLIIEFSYNFLYVWNCMKLYDKKFLIYGNCMIRSFGQPGQCNSNNTFQIDTMRLSKIQGATVHLKKNDRKNALI